MTSARLCPVCGALRPELLVRVGDLYVRVHRYELRLVSREEATVFCGVGAVAQSPRVRELFANPA